MTLFENYGGELAALATAVLWATCTILFTLGSRRIGAAVVNLTRLAFAFCFVSGFHLYSTGSIYPFQTEPWRFGVLALSSFLGLVIGDGALFYAFLRIGPQLAMLVMTLVPVISASFAWFCFGETILPIEFVGIAITVGAIGWVVSEPREAYKAYRSSKGDSSQTDLGDGKLVGVGLAIVGALGQTANLIVTKYALVDGYSELSATEVRVFVSVVILAGWATVRGNLFRTLAKLTDVRAVLCTALGAFVGPFLGIWFSYIAIQNTRIGIAATIMATPPLLLIPLSAMFLHERITIRGFMGTVLAIVGVGILFAR